MSREQRREQPFLHLDPAVLSQPGGTSQEPVFIASTLSTTGLLTKVRDDFFMIYRHRQQQRWAQYRCKHHSTCPWTGRVVVDGNRFQIVHAPYAKGFGLTIWY